MTDTNLEASYERADAVAREMDDLEAAYQRSNAYAREMGDPAEHLENLYVDVDDLKSRVLDFDQDQNGNPVPLDETLYRFREYVCDQLDNLVPSVAGIRSDVAAVAAQLDERLERKLNEVLANQARAELHAKQTRELVFQNMLAAAVANDPGLPAWLAKQKQRNKHSPLSGAEVQNVLHAINAAVKRDPTIDLADPASWEQVFLLR